jgi:hypothetical protein
VFQYLGSLQRPRQIAFTTPAGRTVYDFRTGRAKLPSRAEWVTPRDLPEAERATWIELVRFWERLLLQQSGETPRR